MKNDGYVDWSAPPSPSNRASSSTLHTTVRDLWGTFENGQEWGLDFETYSAADLFEVGIDNYFRDPTTVVLMAGTYTQDTMTGRVREGMLDFIVRPEEKIILSDAAKSCIFDAHNAMFEQLCFELMGIPVNSRQFRDSAMMGRGAGAASALEAAAPQLLGIDKQEMGKMYIQIFSRPHFKPERIGGLMIPAYQTPENPHFNPRIIEDFPDEWRKFKEYCLLDAKLGYMIAQAAKPFILGKEYSFDRITRDMNRRGWPVDMDALAWFEERYHHNLEQIETDFRIAEDAPDLNLGSLPQLKAWCKDRGINAKSFDTASVDRMKRAIERKLESDNLTDKVKRENYESVHHLLRTKQELGGSSLKKLKVIRELTAPDNILRDAYMHAGAGATMRTTGRGAQMQNLKRLDGSNIAQIEEDFIRSLSNDELAANLRQLFRSKHVKGQLIVGDFGSVESRGLGWLAGADWKMKAYADGKDMYKVLASSPEMYGVPYQDVTKNQRQAGKVGELSCGYGAGPDAVESFAKGMGIDTIDAPALVRGWRNTNPEIVALWNQLDLMLHQSVDQGLITFCKVGPENGKHGWTVRITPSVLPTSLFEQVNKRGIPRCVSLMVEVLDGAGVIFLRRMIHGVYPHGRGLRYFKPTTRKTGDLWTDTFTNPKTKQTQHYSIYGGKLSGLLTQSFCREIFMASLADVDRWTEHTNGTDLIGQFHDEIVLDWIPTGALSLDEAMARLENSMSMTNVPGFPLTAEIKCDYRYTK
jgi:DNA polymerase